MPITVGLEAQRIHRRLHLRFVLGRRRVPLERDGLVRVAVQSTAAATSRRSILE